MDLIVNGIVLKVQDYKDKDVLISLFTAELGKITAVIKGVRGANAKLKYAAQPFCFGEWQLAEKNGKFTVTSCSAQSLFFELTGDYQRYSLGCAALEMCDYVLKPNMLASNLLVVLLQALKTLTYDDINEKSVFVKFALEFSKCVGYGFSWDKCANCGCGLIGKIYYSIMYHSFTCGSCSGIGAVEVSKLVYTNIKIFDGTSFEKLNTISVKESTLVNCIHILKLHIENVVGFKIKALDI